MILGMCGFVYDFGCIQMIYFIFIFFWCVCVCVCVCVFVGMGVWECVCLEGWIEGGGICILSPCTHCVYTCFSLSHPPPPTPTPTHPSPPPTHSPLDPECDCMVCKQYTRSFLHFTVCRNLPFAAHLVSYHNVAYMQRLTRNMRAAIREQRFPEFVRTFIQRQYPKVCSVGGRGGG